MRVMAVAAICLQEDHIMYEIVNIERAFACGGNEIAKKLAADLGYTYHGHDVLEEAAKAGKAGRRETTAQATAKRIWVLTGHLAISVR